MLTDRDTCKIHDAFHRRAERHALPCGRRLQLQAGSPVLLVETDDGLVLTTRPAARRLLRQQLDGRSLVAELLSERREAAAAEDR